MTDLGAYDFLIAVEPELFPTYIIAAILYISAAVLSSSLNLLVAVAIAKTPSLWKPSILLLLSLVVTDFLSGVAIFPLMVAINIASAGNELEVFLSIVKITRGMFFYLAAVSLFTITAISIDRLLAIRLTINYRSIVTKRKILIGLGFIWLSPLVLLIMLTLMREYLKLAADGVIVVSGGGLLLIIIIICYSFAFFSLKKMPRVRAVAQEPSSSTQRNGHTAAAFSLASYRKTLFTMVVVCVILVCSLTTYYSSVITSIVIFHSSPSGQYAVYVNYYIFSEILLAYNSVINPVIYMLRMRDIRSAVTKTMRKLFRRELQNGETDNSPGNGE